VESLQQGLCIPWCGAGVSIASGLPDWKGLARMMIDAARNSAAISESQEAELDSLFDAGAFEDVIDFSRERLSTDDYREMLEHIVRSDAPRSRLQNAVARLHAPAIFTTNVDRLIEAAVAERKGIAPAVFTSRDIESVVRYFVRGRFFVLKVHGSIEYPQTVVLSGRDYTKHVFGNTAFMQFLHLVFMSRSVLFIGTALGDAYLRRMLEENAYLTGGVGMPHYALRARSEAGEILSKILRDRFNITVIPCDNHDEVASRLEELADRAPRQD
jgi:hypothetical protein